MTVSKTAYHMSAGRVSEHHKDNARKSRNIKQAPSRLGSYGVVVDNTFPSMPMIDGYGLLMIDVLMLACQDFVGDNFWFAVQAFEWLMSDAAIYLEALEIEAEISDWLVTAAKRDLNFDCRGMGKRK